MVVISVEELERLAPVPADRLPLVAFLECLHLDDLDLERESDHGRDVEL